MNIKGILEQETPKVIIAVLVLLLFIFLGYGMINLFGGTSDIQAKELADSLESKIDALDEGISYLNFIGKEDWVLTGWGRSDEARPSKCYFYSCLCVCPKTKEEISESCQMNGICRRFNTPNIMIGSDYSDGKIKLNSQNLFDNANLILSDEIKNHFSNLGNMNYIELLFGNEGYSIRKSSFLGAMNQNYELNFLFYDEEQLPIYFKNAFIYVMDDDSFYGKKITGEKKVDIKMRTIDVYDYLAVGTYSSDYVISKVLGHDTPERFRGVSGILFLEPRMVEIEIVKNKNFILINKVSR
jgi:hypothetical protein